MDEATRLRLVQLLDKLFDNEASKKGYFDIMARKRRGGTSWDDQWDRAEMKEMIEQIKSTKDTPGQRYDVLEENGVEVLILKRSALFSKIYRKVMVLEESYDVLIKVHRKLGHQGYGPIFNCLKKNWNFPIAFVTALVTSCNVCKILKNIQIVKRDFKAISEGKEIWRLSILDMETECPYILSPKHVLICEDVYSEFLILRPLKENSVDEVSDKLLKVFHEFGSPTTILANPLIIYELLGPALKNIVKTNPQFVVTTDDKDSTTAIRNCDIIIALTSWIEEVECTHYEIDCELGCYVVQRRLNTRLRVQNSIGNPKYKAFVPHNVFLKHGQLISDLWDDNIIAKVVETKQVVNKRKRKKK